MKDQIVKFSKNFKEPDEVRPFIGHGHLEMLNFSEGSGIGRGVFNPGWKWSNDVKPLAGTKSCQASHTGYCLSGSMTIRMDSGEEFEIHEGDAFHIPPGHDAWVNGHLPCIQVDFSGFQNYAKKAA